MGEKTRFYIIIIILAGIVLLQFLWRPKGGATSDKPTFESTLDSIRSTLAEFKTQNDSIRSAASAIALSQSKAEAQYELVRQDFLNKLNAISGQIASARSQYVQLMAQLKVLNEQFKDSGAPDSIPTLDQLTRGN
ncbi:MAG: hypothetical protein U0176_07045 [Bacteroidia bacterium]